MNKLTDNRRWILLGYYNILKSFSGNGRTVHDIGQYLTCIRVSLHLDRDITERVESGIKKLINNFELDKSKCYLNIE